MKARIILAMAVLSILLAGHGAVNADIAVPPSVDFELVSPTEDYHFFIDNNPASSDYYPPLKAAFDVLAIDRTGSWSIGNPLGYDHGYELLLFDEPDFNGLVRNINYWDCDPDGCDNGLASLGQILMPAPLYDGASISCTRMILGHELFHHIQFGYKNQGAHALGSWVTEGHARAMQDKIYTDLDTDPDASCVAPYLGSVKSYLAGSAANPPQQELPIWNNSYRAALWWTYLMEQFGGTSDEPIYGADFITAWYEQAMLEGVAGNSFDTTNETIQSLDPGNDILATFRRFVLANVIKDMKLDNVSAGFKATYSYVDEQPNGAINQNQYAQVKFSGGTLAISDAQQSDSTLFGTWPYGSQYFDIDISGCSPNRIVRIDFNAANASPFFGEPLIDFGAWGVVVGQSSDGSGDIETLRPSKFFKKLDHDWAVEFVQSANPYERVFATTSGVLGQLFGELTAECLASPPIETLGPTLPLLNPINPMTPGPPETLSYGEVCVTPSVPLPNVDPFDYAVAINGEPVLTLAAISRDDGHCLQIEVPPVAPADPVSDLSVTLAGKTVTVNNAIVRNVPVPNVLIAIDTSSTMLLPADNPKLDDVRIMAAELIQQLLPVKPAGPLAKIGLIELTGDDFEPNIDARVVAPLASADKTQVIALDAALAALVSGPNRFTSIGDALQVAIDEFAGAGDTGQGKHLILIIDGSENEGAFWADVKDAVLAAGFSVHVVAVGPLSDQPLAYDIARTTGGHYAYVPVGEVDTDHVALADAVARFTNAITGRVQIASQSHPYQFDQPAFDFQFSVPPQAVSLIVPAVQKVRDRVGDGKTVIGNLTLTAPDNSQYSFDLPNAMVKSYSVSGATELPPGTWQAQLTTDTAATGQFEISVFAQRAVPLIITPTFGRPDVTGLRSGRPVIGQPVIIGSFWNDPCSGRIDCTAGTPGAPTMTVTRPDGSKSRTVLQAAERYPVAPQRSAGGNDVAIEELSIAHEGIEYEFNPAGSPTALPDDGVNDHVGSYNFLLEIAGAYDGYTVHYMATDSYAVEDIGGMATDTDNDLLPDIYENLQACLNAAVMDATLDQDIDGLPTIDEFNRGTDPCNNDTDMGGELDGSEVSGGRDPRWISDDALPGMTYAFVAHEITHVQQSPPPPPGTVTLQFSNHAKYGNLTLKRGVVSGALSPIDTIDAASSNGVYIDKNLTPGNQYCYQLAPFDSKGNSGRPSEELCTTASADPAQPWGDIVINDGAPRTDDPNLWMTVGLYNKDPGSSEMLIDVDGISSGWVPYSPDYRVLLSTSGETRTVSATLRLRDLAGIESPVYIDQILLWPPDTLGELTGRILLEGLNGPSPGPLGRVMVWLGGSDTDPPVYTTGTGEFRFENLKPGTYEGRSGHEGWITIEDIAWPVSAGQTTDIGQVVLPIGSERVFIDGFED